MSFSSSESDATGTESTRSDIEYEYGPVEEFIQLDDIVQYLFDTALLTDVECRKIISLKDPDVVKIRAVIFQIMFTKDSITFKKILEVFRNRVHPFQNPKILLRIFSYLKFADISKCKFVSQDWKEIVLMIVSSKYDEVNLEEHLMTTLLSKNEKIQNTKSRSRKEERKASVFQLMLATNPEKDEAMMEMLKIGRDVPDVNNTPIKVSCTAENKIDISIAKALSNHTVLSNVFQFLSLEHIKNCRRVCRTWYSVSEPFLRKISRIKFDSKLAPTDFLNVAKYLLLPGLPFKSFKFRKIFSSEELSEFFTKYGKHIRSLEICLKKDLRSYLSHTSYLTELNLQGVTFNRSNSHPKKYRMNMIPWSSLHSIKILCLESTVIEVDRDTEWKRITPLQVHLHKVHFFVDGCYPDEITLNDFIDFTKVIYLNVNGTSRQIQKFDWAKDRFAAKKVTFSNTRLVNAGESKSEMYYLKLYCNFMFCEKNCMSIKQLIVREGALSLTALPPSLEKLALYGDNPNIMSTTEPIYLPNLNYLSYRKESEFYLLSTFAHCLNLTDMEIFNITSLDIGWLPMNIKRLKVNTRTGQLKFVGGLANEHINLDVLVLDFIASCYLTYLKLDKFRLKMLVLVISGVYQDEDYVSFIRRNRNIDKIYVLFQSPINRNVFSKTQLSNMVDKKSQYYEFSNQRGKAITYKEFVIFPRFLDIKTVMNGFWNMDEEEHGIQRRKDYYNHNHFQVNEVEEVAVEESEDESDANSNDYSDES